MLLLRVYHKKLTALLLFFSGFTLCGSSWAESPSAKSDPRPALILTIVIDGLSVSQWEGILPKLEPGGLRRFKDDAAFLKNASYTHASTVTASGHATLATGASPARHGIIANEWIDRISGKNVYCTADSAHHYLDEITKKNSGTSPALLKIPTLGDIVREQTGGQSRTYSFSGKDRAAILSAGKSGTAYFYSLRTGRFITSSYYMENYPEWWTRYYEDQPQNRYFGSVWNPARDLSFYLHPENKERSHHADVHGLSQGFPHRVDGGGSKPGPSYYAALLRTPFSNDELLDFTREAITSEKIGKNPALAPDFLTISFSAHDLINHSFGPESVQAEDDLLRLDGSLRNFFLFLDSWIPRDKLIMVLSADHGFENSPEDSLSKGLPGGRIDGWSLVDDLNAHLRVLMGPGEYAWKWDLPTIYLNPKESGEKQWDPAAVETAAAEFLKKRKGIADVLTRTQLLGKKTGGENSFLSPAQASWDPDRSGDLFVVPEQGWYLFEMPHKITASHGSLHPENRKVPLSFSGSVFKPGIYSEEADIRSVAATLAETLNISVPESVEGHSLDFIFKAPETFSSSQLKARQDAAGLPYQKEVQLPGIDSQSGTPRSGRLLPSRPQGLPGLQHPSERPFREKLIRS